MHDPANNKFLTFSDGVVRTEVTDKVISKLDKYFEEFEEHAKVTSVKRTAADQLSIINQYALRYSIHLEFPLHTGDPAERYEHTNYGVLYKWQCVWSRLLNKGVIINPPLRAKVLFDYWRRGVNKKGRMINPSQHFYGNCVDIGGGYDGITGEVEVISAAMASDPNLGIARMVLERKNNCVHLVCK